MELPVRQGAGVNGLCWGWFRFSSRPVIISNRNRSTGFSIMAPTPTAATPKIPAPPWTVSSRLTRSTPSASPPASRSSWPPRPTRATPFRNLPDPRGRNDELSAVLDADPSLVHRRYPSARSANELRTIPCTSARSSRRTDPNPATARRRGGSGLDDHDWAGSCVPRKAWSRAALCASRNASISFGTSLWAVLCVGGRWNARMIGTAWPVVLRSLFDSGGSLLP